MWGEGERPWQDQVASLSPSADCLARKKPPKSSSPDRNQISHVESEQPSARKPTVSPPLGIKPGEDLDQDSLLRLREFFELLDRWDREGISERTGEGQNHGERG